MEKIGKYNVTNVLYPRKENLYLVYVSKHNSNHEKQVILLTIPNGKGWHYLAVTKLSALLRGINSKHHADFYCLNCFATKNPLESHKKVCENKDFCSVIMLFKDTKTLEVNQYQKSGKAPFIIYADLECIMEKIDRCKK